ncbi:cofactor-independent phosphoglycerate mutase [Methanobacterium alcaliphilum]|uniref:cofactor-independent phosphoglycerate mutase n=1 Tax=Methanobacterium alcaliphilum TaxID=392018 RepID=UPI00200B8494|nr:cofactor-independent phosphoglycerate mutase [Methanobacterium alcaliphilum]MCK9150662.1 cofactor-independent phosphoglycerate mutase [Methanobacterium alcaliphilum]
MKYVVLIGDGMADYPLEELNNKTPLQAANKPNMDEVARGGVNGLLETVPHGMEPGSDVANLAIMGYDPEKYYTGRGPLEASSMGVSLDKNDVAFRCNFITNEEGILADFNAGHISTQESTELIHELNNSFGDYGTFYPGVSYRNLFVYSKKESSNLKTTPPHDIVGEPILDHLSMPTDDENAVIINKIMKESQKILLNHEINHKRIKNGKKAANMIWLWGQGKKPQMDSFLKNYGLQGATITGVDLIKGIGVNLGLDNINVPGATGYFDTDYKAKGKYALEALENHDIVFVHVESPDEAGHAGDIKEKIKGIEEIDSKILGPLLDHLPSFDQYKLTLLPDHATPIAVKTHTMDPVPYAVYSPGLDADEVQKYDEFDAKNGILGMGKAHNLINKLINGF